MFMENRLDTPFQAKNDVPQGARLLDKIDVTQGKGRKLA
jgi:hypothetical protein